MAAFLPVPLGLAHLVCPDQPAELARVLYTPVNSSIFWFGSLGVCAAYLTGLRLPTVPERRDDDLRLRDSVEAGPGGAAGRAGEAVQAGQGPLCVAALRSGGGPACRPLAGHAAPPHARAAAHRALRPSVNTCELLQLVPHLTPLGHHPDPAALAVGAGLRVCRTRLVRAVGVRHQRALAQGAVDRPALHPCNTHK